jgi:sugar phosphate isomerase/epimerase
MKQEIKGEVSRRKFLATVIKGAAFFSIVPLNYQCKSGTSRTLPNSNFGGVKIGAITFAFRGLADRSAEAMLSYYVDCGMSYIELMSNVIEPFAGCPPSPVAPARDVVLTPEEQAAYDAARVAAREAQRQWRISVPMTKFKELRKMYNDAGVTIHLAKFSPTSWSDEEIDYAFNAAKALGSDGVSGELGADEASDKRLGSFAEKHKMYAVLHNHNQFADKTFNLDSRLASSPALMLNFDFGHYYGSTGLSSNDFIEKYHDRIYSVHLNDYTGPNGTPPNVMSVWGKGNTPIAEVLTLLKQNVKKKDWPKHADIDDFVLEFPEDAKDPALYNKEVRICVEYCRQILA